MGTFQTLMARDGHEFQAYLAAPAGTPRGGVVVVQEIFGVNHHIRAVTDDYAAQGYVAIAPSLFDRVRRSVELGYSPKEIEEGRGYMLQVKYEHIVKDVGAALNVVRHAGKVGVVGYCWGGTVTYIAACELPIACGSSYYGGSITKYLDKKPKRPMIYHFGERDAHIPMSAIEQIRAVDTDAAYYIYPAGHGFNCTERADYEPASAALARQRTLEFFARHVDAAKEPANDEENR
jgi:carboxymethylenebutenolidase